MAALADLGTYPAWLSLVTAAVPDPPHQHNADQHNEDEHQDRAAWLVTLRARLGPLARSKRLRMVRTSLTDHSVRFERTELDDREHAAWVLSADLTPVDATTSEVKVHLHYSGALWSAPLEIVLASFEGSAADRLSAYLAQA